MSVNRRSSVALPKRQWKFINVPHNINPVQFRHVQINISLSYVVSTTEVQLFIIHSSSKRNVFLRFWMIAFNFNILKIHYEDYPTFHPRIDHRIINFLSKPIPQMRDTMIIVAKAG